jgi:hypothetical protein
MVLCPVRIDTRTTIRPISGVVYREITVVYCKNDSNTLRGKKCRGFSDENGGRYNNNLALNGS